MKRTILSATDHVAGKRSVQTKCFHGFLFNTFGVCRRLRYLCPSTFAWQFCRSLGQPSYREVCFITHLWPRSFSVLGMVPGVIVTISVAASVQYTSYILWKFCMKHPEVRDVCDIGRIIFGGSELAYNLTGLMFVLNNTFIQGASIEI